MFENAVLASTIDAVCVTYPAEYLDAESITWKIRKWSRKKWSMHTTSLKDVDNELIETLRFGIGADVGIHDIQSFTVCDKYCDTDSFHI